MTTTSAERIRALILPTMHGYRASWLRPDLIAGVSAGAVVIPQAMAYATIADLPVQIGLYTCMVPMLVYALLGGSRAMSVSTTSTIATLTATTLATANVVAGSHDALRHLAALGLLVGAMLLIARLLGLGRLVENISEATLIGVKVGVGATVAIGQLPKMLGVDVNVSGQGFIRAIAAIGEAVPRANVATIAVSVGVVAFLLVVRRLVPRIPGPLVAIVACIVLAFAGGLPGAGVDLIAPVPSGLPLPLAPDFGAVGSMVPGALAIAVMAFLESASVARGIRRPGEEQVDSDRELAATGAASLVGSFFQSMPAAGASPRAPSTVRQERARSSPPS